MSDNKKTTKLAIYLAIILSLLVILPISCKRKTNRAPSTPDVPTGPNSTYNRKPEVYKTKATDPDNDQVRIVWDWGDGSTSESDFVNSNEEVLAGHAWTNAGTYNIKVKAIDDKDAESGWSSSLTVTVTYNAPPRIDSISGPGLSPYYAPQNSCLRFKTVAYDSTDNVYVRFLYKKVSAARYTTLSWIGPKASGSIFEDSITFTQPDTYLIRAIAKDTKGSESDTSQPIYKVIIIAVTGPIWEFQTEDEYEFYSSPALGQDAAGNWRLYIGGADGYFYSINVANGSKVFAKKSIYDPEDEEQLPEDVFNATPAVNQYFSPAHIYCGGYEGELYCFTTGAAAPFRWLWRYPDSAYGSTTGYEFGSSVAFKDNRLYVGCDDHYFYALQDNGSSATLLWRFYTGSEIWSSPAIDASGNVYFGDDSGYVRCLNQNGTQLWRNKVGTGVATSPALTSSRVYVGTDDGNLYALNITNGTEIWHYTAEDAIRSSPVIGSDGTIYFGCNDGKLYALTTAGTLKAGFPIQLSDDELQSTPAIASDGTIVVYTYEDVVYGITPSGQEVWRVLLPGYGKSGHKRSKFETFYPSPTIGPDGTVYVASAWGGVFAAKKITNNPLASTSWPKFRHDIRNSGNFSSSR